MVEFRVSASGDVRNVKVVGAAPAVFFDKAAMDAANKFKFTSQRFAVNDRVQHKFTFSLDSEPNEAVVAEYPAAAKEQQIHGHVIVEFDINTEGEVENPEAIYSDASVLETAAIAAVSEFSFDPNEPVQGVLHKIELNLNQDWQRLTSVEPEYPRQALLDNIEGYAIVRFELDEKGLVDNASVVAAKPRTVFNESALSAVEQFKYIPKYVDDQPTRVKGIHIRIQYEIAGEKGKSPGRDLDDKSPNAQPRHPMFGHKLKPTHTLYI